MQEYDRDSLFHEDPDMEGRYARPGLRDLVLRWFWTFAGIAILAIAALVVLTII